MTVDFCFFVKFAQFSDCDFVFISEFPFFEIFSLEYSHLWRYNTYESKPAEKRGHLIGKRRAPPQFRPYAVAAPEPWFLARQRAAYTLFFTSAVIRGSSSAYPRILRMLVSQPTGTGVSEASTYESSYENFTHCECFTPFSKTANGRNIEVCSFPSKRTHPAPAVKPEQRQCPEAVCDWLLALPFYTASSGLST